MFGALLVFSLWVRLAWPGPPLQQELPEIRVSGFSSSANEADSLPSNREGTFEGGGSAGGIQRDLFRELPLPVVDGSRPGGASFLPGAGRSAEETEVEALGVPLNAVQGGGFDLSLFPQFLFGGYSFRLGPSAGGLDPRAAAGVLSLRTRSEQMLEGPRLGEGGGLFSTAQITQLYSAFALPGRVAVVGGGYFGALRGGALGASVRWAEAGAETEVHLLGVYQEGDVEGSTAFPTPGATQTTARLIPVVHTRFRLGPEAFYQVGAFHDFGAIDYREPGAHGLRYSNRALQFGLDQVVWVRSWRGAVNFRRAGFVQDSFVAPQETAVTTQLGRRFLLGAVAQIEPMLRAVWVSGFLPRVGASIAGHQEWGAWEGTQRLSWFPRMPSLLNRYYRGPFFEGNPELQPEDVVSLAAGLRWRPSEYWSLGVDSIGQIRWNVLATAGVTRPYQEGWGLSGTWMPWVGWQRCGFSLEQRLGWIESWFSEGGGACLGYLVFRESVG